MKKEYLLKIMSTALCGTMLIQSAAIPSFAEEAAVIEESDQAGTSQGGEEASAAREAAAEEAGNADISLENPEAGEKIVLFSEETESAGESAEIVSEDGEAGQQDGGGRSLRRKSGAFYGFRGCGRGVQYYIDRHLR